MYLELNNVTKSLNTDCKILDDISFKMQSGDFWILLGTNGSGKSSLLKCISGYDDITSGEINIKFINNNCTIGDKNENHRIFCDMPLIQMISQSSDCNVIDEMSIAENIILYECAVHSPKMRIPSILESFILKKIRELSSSFYRILSDKLDAPVSVLSGGQRQILSILMTLSVEPQILLLDEHTSALDAKNSDLIMRITDDYIKKNNIPAIMITHRLHDAIAYGNGIIIMHNGKIIKIIDENQKSNITAQQLFEILENTIDLQNNLENL